MGSKKQLLVQSLLTAVVLVAVGMLGFSSQFYGEALYDAFFGLALASVVIVHQRVGPSWLDAAWTAAGMAVLGIVDFHFLHYPPKVMAWFSFAGLSSFAILALRSIWSQNRRKFLYAWIPAAAFVMSDYFASNMLEWTAKAHPKTLDLYLLSFDGSLRTQLAFVAGQLYARIPTLHNLRADCLHRIGHSHHHDLCGPAGAFQGRRISGHAGVSCCRAHGNFVLQLISGIRPAQLIPGQFSVPPISYRGFGAAAFSALGHTGSAKCDALVALGMDAAGLVVFARTELD